MRLWYLSYRRPAKAQVSLRICAVSPEPSLFTHMKYGSGQRIRPKIRWIAAHACLKNEFSEDKKCHNLMIWLSLSHATLVRLKLACSGMEAGNSPFGSYSCLMTKPTKWHVRPAKTQISLGIHQVFAGRTVILLVLSQGRSGILSSLGKAKALIGWHWWAG